MAAGEAMYPDTALHCICFPLALHSSGRSLPPGQGVGMQPKQLVSSHEGELQRDEEKEPENLFPWRPESNGFS